MQLERKQRLIQTCQHKNIVKIQDIIFEDNYVNLISEYCQNGDLYDYIFDQGMLSEKEAIRLFVQILDGLEYLHSKNIAHCDLKSENIFLDKNKNVKIGDFGFAIDFQQNQKVKSTFGSLVIAPPEYFENQCHDPKKGDIWGAGLILYSMITGSHPWKGNTKKEIINQIINCDIYYPFNVSVKMKELLKSILKKNPDERLSIDSIREFIRVNFHYESIDLTSQNHKIGVTKSYLYPMAKTFL
jgi:serine/threonine protein kinase